MTPRAKFVLGAFTALGLAVASIAVASPPTAPGALTAVSASSTQINLAWTASTDSGATITAYIIQRCSGSSCTNFAQVGSVPSGTSYSDSGLTAATAYRYQVYATDSNTTSSPISNIATATTLVTSISSAVTYGYDALGRLVQANVAALNIVENYTYDSAGNITSVSSSPTATLAVSNLSSPQGAAGSTVTIFGSGFSTTPSSDTVQFNGVAATVISATSTQLVVTVPSNATNGPVTVKTGTTTVSSTGGFTVTARTPAPTITSFPPSSPGGSTIVITGTGFQPALADNAVLIGNTWASVVSATSTSLTVVVPVVTANNFGLESGPIIVTTPFGTVTSATAFTTFAYAIGSIGIMTAGGAPATIDPSPGFIYYVELFNGIAGSNLALSYTGGSLTNVNINVIAPNGAYVVSNAGFSATAPIQIPTLPATGVYTILVYPNATSGTASFNLVNSVSGTLVLNGAPANVTLGTAGQASVLTFSGTQASYVSLAFSNVTLTASTVTVFSPDGTTLASSALTTAGATLLPELPRTGTYTVTVVPTGTKTGAFTAALTSTAAPTLPINQGPYNLTLTNATPVTFTFDGSAGEYLSLAATQTGTLSSVNVTVKDPNGTQISNANWTFSWPPFTNLGPLTRTGTYTVTIQQNGSNSGTLALTAATPLSGTASIGTPTNATVSLLGQGIAESFQANAGQYISVGMTGSANGITSGTIWLLDPSGKLLSTGSVTAACVSCVSYGILSSGPLPTTGTYTALFQQGTETGAGTGTMGMAIAQAQPGNLSLGTPSSVTLSYGQSIEETFTASAGQILSIALSGPAGAGPTAGAMTILDPNGLPVSTPSSGACVGPLSNCAWNGVVSVGPLALSGTYTFLFQQSTGPSKAVAGAVTVTPTLAAGGTLLVGTASPVTLTAGQGFAETLTGTAGEYLSIGLQSVSSITSGVLTVLSPSGAVIASVPYFGTCSGANCSSAGNISVGPLPTTGSYTIEFSQNESSAGVGSGAITVTAATPVTGTLTVGSPSTVSVVDGQGVELSFPETAGDYDTVTLSETSGKIYQGTFSILTPAGTVLKSQGFGFSCPSTCTGSSTFNLGPLPTTGNYHVLVQQGTQGASQGAGPLTLLVTKNPAGSGVTQNLTTTVAGQAVQFTFSAAISQPFNLAITSLVLTPSSVTSVGVSIKNPSGTVVAGYTCYPNSVDCPGSLGSFTQNGTYSVTVTPSGSATMTGTATLSTPAVAALTVGTPVNLNLANGQAALLMFSATANQTLAFNLGSITTSPAGGPYFTTIANSAGQVVATANPSSPTTINLPNLPAGTYTISLAPGSSASGTLQATLAAGVTGTLPIAGAGVSISTSTPGETAYYSFLGTSAQSATVVVSNLAVTPSSTQLIAVTGPTNPVMGLVSGTCYAPSCTVHLPYLPQTQNYNVSFAPNGQATMSFIANVVPDATGALSYGVPLNLALATAGQSALLTFEVTSEAEQTPALYISNFANNPTTSTYHLTIYSNVSSVAGQYTQVASAIALTSAAQTVNLPKLAAGTYVVLITPTSAAVASMQLTLAPAAIAVVPSDGTPISVSTAEPGEGAYLNFQGIAGQSLALLITNLAFTPATTAALSARAYSPDAVQVGYNLNCVTSSSPSCEVLMPVLPVSGTYSLAMAPPNASMSFNASLPPVVTATIPLNTPTNESLSVPGQIAALSFNATAGQNITVSNASIATTPSGNSISATVYNSIAQSVGPLSVTGSAASPITIHLTALPAGTYTILVSPQALTTETMTVTLTSP